MGAGNNADAAKLGAVHRTIPNRIVGTIAVAVTSATDTTTLTAAQGGKWVFLVARGGDVTVLRGTHTMLAGKGVKIADGKFEEVYIDPAGGRSISHIGSAACSLDILDDSDFGPANAGS